MLLAIDVGNTNSVIGILDGTCLKHRWRIATDPRKTGDEYAILLIQLCGQSGVELSSLGAVALTSVVPDATSALVSGCEDRLGLTPLVVTSDLDLGIEVDYDHPAEVGADRLVNAVAARELVDGAAIIVDFGTATTFDVLTEDGRYVGGAIAPGVRTSAENLFRRAALLFRVGITPPERAIGRTTEQSVRSGIVFGVAGQVEGIVARLTEELGTKPTVVATGGLAAQFAMFAPSIDMVEPDLTLLGLALIDRRLRGKAR